MQHAQQALDGCLAKPGQDHQRYWDVPGRVNM